MGERLSYRNPVGNQITFVDNEHNLLVGLFLLNILQHGFAHRTKRVASVQDVENDVRGINDFVQLSVNSTRCAFLIDRLVIICMGLGLNNSRSQRFYGVRSICCFICRGSTKFAKLFECTGVDSWLFPLCFGAKCVCKGLGLNYMGALSILSELVTLLRLM